MLKKNSAQNDVLAGIKNYFCDSTESVFRTAIPHRKRPELLEITSFDDAARVVCRGSQGIKILQGRKSWVMTHENGQK